MRTPAMDPGQYRSTNASEMLRSAAMESPDGPAIVDADTSVSYQELECRASAVAAALSALGIGPGPRVAVWMDRGSDPAACFFGAAALGAITVMVNETLRPRQVEHILSDCDAEVLITTQEMLDRQQRAIESPARCLLTTEIPGDGAKPFEPVPCLPDDPVQIVYTSGSTGLPKGVTLSHGNLLGGTASVSTYLGLGESDRIASLLPFSFDYGFSQLLCAVANRATLVVERSPMPATIVSTLRRREVTVLPCVPPQWLQLLGVRDFRETPIPSLRILTNTGGHLPLDAVEGLRRAQPTARLYLMYGLTEAFRGTFLPPEEVDRRPGSIGRAIPGCEILVLREDGTECEPGEVGELVQRGITVALGYWDDPEATERVFRPNPLRPPGTPPAERVVFSGDLVRKDDDGFLTFVGRRDRMIKTLGYRVSPDEIVDAIHASGQVAEAIVTAEPDELRGSRIVAHVVLGEGGDEGELESFLRRELPRYMQPARIEVRDELPRTHSGKHDARSLG